MEAITKPKTREDVDTLKRNWLSDPCYDITDIEGFEEYEAELVVFAQEQEALWAARRAARDAEAKAIVLAKAGDLGIPGNIALAGYVMALEQRISQLEARLDNE